MPNTLRYQTIVAGGGVAGVAAAIASARLGTRTLLVERYGFLGGLATAGLVNPFMTHRTSTGTPLIAGFYAELTERLASLGGLAGTTFDSEAMKLALQEMLLESGADLLLHTWVSDVIMTGSAISGIRIANKSGESVGYGSRFVDATGDGDLAANAGARFDVGGTDGLPQAMTMMFDVGGVDFARMFAYVKDHPDQFRFPILTPDADPEELARGIVSVAGYYDIISEAKERGEYSLPGDLIFFVSRPRRGEAVFNTTHVGGVTGTNAADLTRAEIEGRRQAAQLMSFVQKHIPGFETAYLLRTATQIGVRETRRIIGEYTFGREDVSSARKFADAIARLAYPVDVHSGKGEGYTKDEKQVTKPCVPPAGDWYEIPYRCLLPVDVENLLVAGRCVSSTHEGHGALRIIPCCAAMGQAAGTAAALSLADGVSPRKLDVERLKEELRRQNALV